MTDQSLTPAEWNAMQLGVAELQQGTLPKADQTDAPLTFSIGTVVQMVELAIVIYLVIMAVSFGNVLAKEWITPVIALVATHNSAAPAEWGGRK